MLDVNTLPKVIEKLKNLTSIEMFSVEIAIEKESEEGRMLIQNKCVSSQKIRMKKEEGATVGVLSSAILPYLSQRAASLFLRRAVGQ